MPKTISKKHGRRPSLYNNFMKENLPVVKSSHPELSHKEAFVFVANMWKDQKSDVTAASKTKSSTEKNATEQNEVGQNEGETKTNEQAVANENEGEKKEKELSNIKVYDSEIILERDGEMEIEFRGKNQGHYQDIQGFW
ncbi:hypothetical protein BB558_005385 [Smittium angustum]|uniref:YABBY protein C-terminal domain-containing protein n=1 Tax=Smittium angustum TaxID=133377 RepID=A0A2U1J0L9_SMIAN|nr:hypothetical protein BB558_005385 [Smittium angustum]